MIAEFASTVISVALSIDKIVGGLEKAEENSCIFCPGLNLFVDGTVIVGLPDVTEMLKVIKYSVPTVAEVVNLPKNKGLPISILHFKFNVVLL